MNVLSLLLLIRTHDRARRQAKILLSALFKKAEPDLNVCGQCPIKAKCTTGKERRVKRWEHEAILDRVQKRLDNDPSKIPLRSKTIEHTFGTLKAWVGATHFKMKTMKHVATEMALHVLAYNMMRVIAIIGVPRLYQRLIFSNRSSWTLATALRIDSKRVSAGGTPMTKRILICSELSPQDLRQASFSARTRRERQRMQAIANAMEGMLRAEAARLADMSDQALKDAVKRYNAEGLPGLADRPHTGRPRKLDTVRREQLHDIALAGPDIEKDHLSAYTREDLAGIVKAKWNVSYDPTSIGRLLREMGLSRQKTRPSHPKKNPEAGEAFLKNAGRVATTC